MTANPETARRAEISAHLWQIAEQHIVAEWICCEPLDPKHHLCAKGYAALGMAKTLLVDSDPEKTRNPAAPVLDAVMQLLPAVVSSPPATDRATLRDRIRRVLAQSDGFDFDSLEPHDYQIQAAALLAVLPDDDETDAPAAECSAQHRAFDGTRWAVLHDPGDLAVRRVWTAEGWQMAWASSHEEIYCWPDAASALAAARQAQAEDDREPDVDGAGRTPESYRDRPTPAPAVSGGEQ